jgi:hypothetical protein
MATKINKALKVLLASIVAATNSKTGYALVDPTQVKALVDGGYIEVNASITDPSGKVAARATASLLASSTVVAAPVAKPSFELVSGIAPVAAKRGGVREEVYPFSKMEVGQSFFIAATDKTPSPAESFTSTVTSAIRRFSVPTGATRTNKKGVVVPELKPTKKFVIRAVVAGQKYENGFTEFANGARIFRTE